jgi:hypothetical protein
MDQEAGSRARIFVLLTCVGLVCACSSAPKPETGTDEPDLIVPVEKDYRASFDAAWSAVEDMFDDQEVPVVQVDASEGTFKTDYLYGDLRDADYINTRSTMYRHGWVEETRYKLDVTIVRLSEGETRIIIEAQFQGKLASTDWTHSRYREGAWYDFQSTGGVELDLHEEIAVRLVEYES